MKKWLFFILAILGIGLIVTAYFLGQAKPPIEKTAIIRVDIRAAPDFDMALNTALIITYPNRIIAFNALCTGKNEFAGEITISISGLPTGITAEILPNDTFTLGLEPKGVQINLTIPDDSGLVGIHDITVLARSTNYN